MTLHPDFVTSPLTEQADAMHLLNTKMAGLAPGLEARMWAA